MAEAVTWVVIGIAYACVFIGCFFAGRQDVRRTVNPLGSPKCDRCGKSTEKPWLWSTPRRRWHCSPREGEIAEILFANPSLAKDYRKDLY